jgi:hypothetical protein
MIRYRTYPICQKCDRQWPASKPLILQIPKFILQGSLLVAGPGIQDQRVIEEMMVNACERGVGCWSVCCCGKNFNQKCHKQCVMRGVENARPGDCPCVCACRVGCGNQKKYPCRCSVKHDGKMMRYVDIFHNKGCPVADFKRTSSFVTALVRRRLTHKGVVGR